MRVIVETIFDAACEALAPAIVLSVVLAAATVLLADINDAPDWQIDIVASGYEVTPCP